MANYSHHPILDKKCTLKDCEKKHATRGYCAMHYERWKRSGFTDPYYLSFRSHGLTKTPEYRAWADIKTRCFKPDYKQYKDYGGRGIKMCQEWRDNFSAFLEHVGNRPSKEYSIERINNDGNYEPGNVKWATRVEQNNNQRPRRKRNVITK